MTGAHRDQTQRQKLSLFLSEPEMVIRLVDTDNTQYWKLGYFPVGWKTGLANV